MSHATSRHNVLSTLHWTTSTGTGCKTSRKIRCKYLGWRQRQITNYPAIPQRRYLVDRIRLAGILICNSEELKVCSINHRTRHTLRSLHLHRKTSKYSHTPTDTYLRLRRPHPSRLHQLLPLPPRT